MKKSLILLFTLFLAAPLYADTITFSSPGDGVIHYEATGAIAPVAMALDVDADGTIIGVMVDSFFDIYMDSAHDMEMITPGSYTYGAGIPTAHQDVVGELPLPQQNFCISMGGLGGETEPLDPAPMSGEITLTAGTATSVTITENALRGGVVGTDGVKMTVTGLPIISTNPPCCDCMAELGVDVSDPDRYYAFIQTGSPECWCQPQQCHGNADGLDQGNAKTGYYAVGGPDLKVLLAGWGIQELPYGPGIAGIVEPISGVPAACANFNNDNGLFGGDEGCGLKCGVWYVGAGDLQILLAHWGILEPPFGAGVPGDCLPGNR